LIAGVTAVRTTADSIQDLWSTHDVKSSSDRRVVREALSQGTQSVADWFAELSNVLLGSDATLSEPDDFSVSFPELVTTVRHDLSDVEGSGTAVAFKIVWTDDYLRQLHQLQRRMLPVIATITSARSTSSRRARSPHLRNESRAAL
jgi:hypothetical protein